MLNKILLLGLLIAGGVAPACAADDQPTASQARPVADFQIDQFQGSVVLVDFWASWCAPCRDSLPWLNAMQRKYIDQGLQVVLVNLDQDAAAAAKMEAGIVAGIRQFRDPDGELAATYELEGMPSSYLYDRSGVLLASEVGFLKSQRQEREQAIVAALARKEP